MAASATLNKPSSGSQEDKERSIPPAEKSPPAGSSQDSASASVEREDQAAEAERPASESAGDGGDGDDEAEGEGEEEEAGECGFCLFMKSGPCRDSFIKWEECVENAEKDKEDIVDKCHKVTFLLKECMEQNSDYYEPVLQAERAMSEEADSEAAAASHIEGEEADSEAAESPHNDGQGEKTPSTADSSEQLSKSPAQNQHSPESENSSQSVQENTPSE